MSDRLKIVEGISKAAGRIALDMRNDLSPILKEDGTFVTEADLAVQQFIFERLRNEFPEYGILAEEEGGCEFCDVDSGRPLFVVDPIDGTDVYKSGLAYFCVSIGLFENGGFTLGVIYLPVFDQMYSVDKDEAPKKDGVAIGTCLDCEIHDHSFLAAPSRFHKDFVTDFPGKIRSLGSTAFHIALVASGQAVGAIPMAHIWDIAAGVALIEASGGKVAHFSGKPVDFASCMNPKKLPKDILFAPKALFNLIASTIKVK